MFGVETVGKLCLVAFYSEGHVLLEGNPGLGKTELIKTLGRVLALPFGRIQFTPDLMPADITGTWMPDFENRNQLRFRQGPIFTNLLLADEINRATPKTQSAMLEAMAERQVTVLGERYQLDPPFFVLATQNPIDHEGTFALPEAQADRFMFKIAMPTPDNHTLRAILAKQTAPPNPESGADLDRSKLPRDVADSKAKFAELGKRIRATEVLPSVEHHVLNLFAATNGRFNQLQGLTGPQTQQLKALLDDALLYGFGPRAAVALQLGAKAWTLLFEDKDQADAESLAHIIIPALRHRLQLSFDWLDRQPRAENEPSRLSAADQFLVKLCGLCAPAEHAYRQRFEARLDQIAGQV
nr:AAA family ATPase [Acanthopleuribacter pedis]